VAGVTSNRRNPKRAASCWRIAPCSISAPCADTGVPFLGDVFAHGSRKE